MILRTCALCLLLSLAAAQETSPEVPTDESDMMTDMTEEITEEATQPTQPMMMTDAPTISPTEFMPNLEEQFGDANATTLRRRHFYCLGFNMSIGDFPRDNIPTSDVTNSRCTGAQCVLWTLFIQYPVLSYLDSRRKERLFSIVTSLAQRGAGTALNGLTVDQFCIANVTHNRVSTYSESVLVSLYFQGGGPVRNPADPANSPNTVEIMQFDTYFKNGFREAANDPNDMRVVSYEGRYAINVSYSDPAHGSTDENSHPLARNFETQRNRDPTIHAIVLNSFPRGGVSVSDAEGSLSPGNIIPQQFANNPNPINFHLEAGDIVFAVFGTIFLTILMGVVILGFCIHPFFLA